MNANKYIIIICLFIGFNTLSQTSRNLKSEQAKIQLKINQTKSLIGESKENQGLALDQISILQSRISLRQELLGNINQQLVKLENEIRSNKAKIEVYDAKVIKLKDQFKKLVRAAYKYRNKYDNIIYVFSADDFNEANKRMKYVEKLKDYRIKQIASIKRTQEELLILNQDLESKKQEQLSLIANQEESRKEIIKDQLLKKSAYDKLKGQESKLLADLKVQQMKQAELDNAIAAALKKELEAELAKAAAERKRRAKAEAERKRLAALKKPKVEPKVTTPTKPVEKPVAVIKSPPKVKKTDFTVTKEVALTGASFASNKGKLPWPVSKGTVTKKYGKHAHPIHAGVYTNNNGIDISTSKGATVRAIYEGKVTSVLVISGVGKVVIVAHGNYRTVYTNLKEAYVKKGDKVSLKQKIGALLPSTSGKTSTAHFEIHVIKDGAVSKLNPSLWITK